jgi:hypothetical protein
LYNGMNSYRWNSVDLSRFPEVRPDSEIPVLIGGCPPSKMDGVLAHGFTPTDELKPELARVRRLPREALQLFVEDGPRFAKEYGAISDQASVGLLGLLDLVIATKDRDVAALYRAGGRLPHAMFPQPGGMIDVIHDRIERDPGGLLADVLGRGIWGVRLVLWQRVRGENLTIQPGLLCPDVAKALYTLVLLQMGGGLGIQSCLQCGSWLVRQRLTRKFCSPACRYKHFERRRMSAKGERIARRRTKR